MANLKNKITVKQSLTIVALLIVVFIFGCNYNSVGKNEFSETNQSTENKIKIGFVGPFSGNTAVFGEMMQNGLDIAMAELPKEYQNKIEIIKEDDMCNGKQAVIAVQKLVDINNVDYVIGPLCNEATISTENLFEDNKVISLTIGLPSNSIANMGEYHFSFAPEIEYLMGKISDIIIQDGHKKVAVIHMSAAFEEENYVHFVKYFTKRRGEIVEDQSAVKGTTDFRSQILKIKETNPDAIMIIAHTGELINILNQLEEMGLGDVPKYGIHAAESPVILEKAKETAEGLTYPYPADKNEIPSASQYNHEYKEKYNFDADPYSANVYDSLKILVNSIEECGEEYTECVREKLANLKEYNGANGVLSVDERGVGTYKEIMIKQVKNGKFQKVE